MIAASRVSRNTMKKMGMENRFLVMAMAKTARLRRGSELNHAIKENLKAGLIARFPHYLIIWLSSDKIRVNESDSCIEKDLNDLIRKSFLSFAQMRTPLLALLVLAPQALAGVQELWWNITFVQDVNPDGLFPRQVIGVNNTWP